ncbi:MAG: hypothetical protein ABIJ95_08130 [Pseudomonadota bacterium]
MAHTLEIAIAAASRGPGRVQEGAVVAVRPAGAGWGRAERKNLLIVPATGISRAEALRLCDPQLACGKSPQAMEEGDDRTILRKRRFTLPPGLLKTGWLPGLDLARVADPREAYQPLLEAKAITIVDFGAKVAICKDEQKGSYRFAERKIA